MKILILGGIAESRELALALIEAGHQVIYSIAGLVRQPDLPCPVHSGGFSDDQLDGVQGLTGYCRINRIDLLIDSTHPYAVNISANAVAAAADAAIPCWRFDRPGWNRDDHPTGTTIGSGMICCRRFAISAVRFSQSGSALSGLPTSGHPNSSGWYAAPDLSNRSRESSRSMPSDLLTLPGNWI